jgi:hypothetical protein
VRQLTPEQPETPLPLAPAASESPKPSGLLSRAAERLRRLERREKERRPYSRTGIHTLKRRVKVRGLMAIDKRTKGAQELLDWRAQLYADLGGEAEVTAAQRALIESAARTLLFIGTVDAWLLEQPTLVNRRNRAVWPALRERQQLVDSLTRILGVLGLERRAKKVPDLETYLRHRYGGDASSDPPSPAPGKGASRRGVTGAGSSVVPDSAPTSTLETPEAGEEVGS